MKNECKRNVTVVDFRNVYSASPKLQECKSSQLLDSKALVASALILKRKRYWG